MRRRLLASLLGLVAASAITAGSEGWARRTATINLVYVADPPGMKYALAPDQAYRGRGWVEGAEPPPHKRRGWRVLCLGDSVTFGLGVDPRDAWPEVLQRLLRERLGRPEVTVHNFAVNGWDAEQVASLAESRLAPWEPDLLVWGSFGNDLVPTLLLYDREGHAPVYVGTQIPERARVLPLGLSLWLVRKSALFRILQGAVYARRVGADDPMGASPSFYARNLRRLADWAAGQAVPLLVAAIPPHVLANPATCPRAYGGDAAPCRAALERHETLTGILEEQAVEWVDVLPAYQVSGQDAFFPARGRDPDHPNEAGHAFVAGVVLPYAAAALGLEAAPASQ